MNKETISYITNLKNKEWQEFPFSIKTLCPNLICRNLRVKVFLVTGKTLIKDRPIDF